MIGERIELWHKEEYHYPAAHGFIPIMVSYIHEDELMHPAMLVLPAAAARNVARNMRQYHLFSLLGAVISGLAGLMTSYYIGSSAGASITLYLAVWFAVTFLLRKKCI